MDQMFATKLNTASIAAHKEFDDLSRFLTRQLLAAHDCYRTFTSNALINTLKRYVNLKLKYEGKSWNSVQDIRRKLYLIHEYNVEIYKLTHKYPKIRNFDLLLAKYIELEYEILYKNNRNIDKSMERRVSQRILRLLYIIFQQKVTEEEWLTKHTDLIIKKAILQLFVDIKFEYFNEDKFIYNTASKLISEFDENCNISNCNLLFQYLKKNFSTSKNSTTSDYGSDDSDTDEINYGYDSNSCTNTETPIIVNKPIIVRKPKEVEEVPVTTKNGVQPVVTFEFINDDDEFMVYLTKKSDNRSSQNNNNCDEIQAINNDNNTSNNNSSSSRENDSSVVVLSDNEESVQTTQRKNKRKKKKKSKNKQVKAVVTFEIMDDDDDGGYIVSLQKEVETKSKRKKLIIPEPVILSDSDESDDVDKSVAIKEEPISNDIKTEPSIVDKDQLQSIEIKNEDNNELKLEQNELDLKVDIVIEKDANIINKNELKLDLLPNDPCLSMGVTNSNFEENTSIIEHRLNDTFLEEILESGDLSKRDFGDLEYFLFDTTDGYSFSQYCGQFSDDEGNLL